MYDKQQQHHPQLQQQRNGAYPGGRRRICSNGKFLLPLCRRTDGWHYYQRQETHKEPPRILAFQFQGYAIWLDLEQQQHQQQHEPKPCFLNPPPHTTTTSVEETKQDLDDALRTAGAELGVAPIPAPHVTALYGIQHLSEDEVRQRFQDVANELFWFRHAGRRGRSSSLWDSCPMSKLQGRMEDKW